MRFANQLAMVALLAIAAINFNPAPTNAQTSVFCPPAVPMLQAGSCTNGTHGSLGVPALATQSVSQVSQSITQQSNGATVEALRRRRAQEAGSPAATSGVLMFAPQSLVELPYQDSAPFGPPPPRAYMLEPVVTAVHSAVWTYGFGGFESRTANSQTTFPLQPTLPMNVNILSKTGIWGVVSGADLTFSNIGPRGGTLIAGLLTGYTESNIDLLGVSTSATASNPGTSLGTTHVRLTGPSAGAYATIFQGPISADLTFKVDFLNINDSFFQSLDCCAPPVLSSGTASSHVDNLSTIGNFYYRFPLYRAFWIEPTVGFNYTYSLYDSSAQALGLASGYVLRLQEGARVGSDFYCNDIHVTPTIAGLLYDDVVVTGGPIVNGAFVGGELLPSDQGKLRAQGILTLNFDYLNGLSSFASATIYGGEDLFGAGGKAGLRYQW
jgi:autotransporter-like protein